MRDVNNEVRAGGPEGGDHVAAGDPMAAVDRVPDVDASPAQDPASAVVAVGPWVRRSRRSAYENAWVTMWHDEVTRPDGGAGIYGVVHFANLAAGVVVLDDHDRVLLVGQHRYPLDAWSWEIPEGGVTPPEAPLDGIRRELQEETGVEAAEWIELARFHLSNSVTDEAGILYLATIVTHGAAEPEPTEEIESRWVAFDEALAMTLDGRITDAMSIIGLQRVALARVAGLAAGSSASRESPA
jgi:8-oxo-dGTP pyrophosphatase MutT (NUDIX family)